jgi:hypothetical protein
MGFGGRLIQPPNLRTVAPDDVLRLCGHDFCLRPQDPAIQGLAQGQDPGVEQALRLQVQLFELGAQTFNRVMGFHSSAQATRRMVECGIDSPPRSRSSFI